MSSLTKTVTPFKPKEVKPEPPILSFVKKKDLN